MHTTMPESFTAQPDLKTSPLQRPLTLDFRLGAWLVCPSMNQISPADGRSGAKSLEPRLSHLLCFLAANRDRVLTREQLTRELWPHVIVNENSLTRAVSELRKQLISSRDDATVYVQTVSKRGYRLAADIRFDDVCKPAALATLHLPFSKQRRWYGAALVASLGLMVGINSLPLTGTVVTTTDYAEPTAQVYDRVISENDLSFHTGNGNVALLGASRSEQEFWTSDRPVFSNDGKSVAMIRYNSAGSTIYLGNIDTGQTPIAIYSSGDFLYNLSWSPVGNALLFARQAPVNTTTLYSDSKIEPSLMMLNLDNFEVKKLLPTEPQPDNSSDSAFKLT
jgi:DNA-binding winged helix-turn-helix (wHTH) protein